VNIKKISVVILSIFSLAGVAHASPNACPTVASIKQTADQHGGLSYTAPALNGQQWEGENPMGDENDLNRVKFSVAYIHNAALYVTCDYTGMDDADPIGIRMALTSNAPVSPAGNKTLWTNETQRNGTVLPRCAATNPNDCKFE